MSRATQLHHRRSLPDSLEIINRHGLPGYVKSAVCQELYHAVTRAVWTRIGAAWLHGGGKGFDVLFELMPLAPLYDRRETKVRGKLVCIGYTYYVTRWSSSFFLS